MATSSILGGMPVPEEIKGKDVQSLGPSDNSDSGSDAVGAYGSDELASDTDAVGTGESDFTGPDSSHSDADILPDHIEQSLGEQDDIDSDTGRATSSEFTDAGDLGEVGELADDSEDEDEPGKA